MDLKGRTAAREPDDARQGHSRPASGFGKFVGIAPAPGERRQVDRQLGDIRGHHRSRGRVREREFHQRILGGHRRRDLWLTFSTLPNASVTTPSTAMNTGADSSGPTWLNPPMMWCAATTHRLPLMWCHRP
ncbi:MAG TPA: hypothetical protein VG125_27350 [Pirellulales bacterium]|nr:hypothetical protein [Pirellulales bacterium]